MYYGWLYSSGQETHRLHVFAVLFPLTKQGFQPWPSQSHLSTVNATCSTNTDFSRMLLLTGKEQRESTKVCGSKPHFLLRDWSCGVENSYQVVLETHSCSQGEVLWARQSPLLHHPQTILINQCHFSLFPLCNIKRILFMSWEPKFCGSV